MVPRKPDYNQPPHPFRPKGVWALPLARFRHLNEILDLNRDKLGIFGSIKQLDPVPHDIRVTGLDPDQKELISAATEYLTRDAFELHAHNRTSIRRTSHARNRLRTNASRKEKHQRNTDQHYSNALLQLNNGSNKDPQRSQAYVDMFFATLEIMIDRRITENHRLE